MRFTQFTAAAAVVLATLLVAGLFSDARGQAGSAAVKVAVASPSKIFASIQKTTDLNAKLKTEVTNWQNVQMRKTTELQDLKVQRDQLRPDSPQFAEANRHYMEKGIELETWVKISQGDIQRNMKLQTAQLYEEIAAATAEVAAQRGIDLVIAEQKPEFDFEAVNIDQLKALLGQRNILFMSATADINSAVITAMDLKYKGGK